ncbi:Transportin-1 [Tetrabaena socialis]|uniref:Transportin-1 n=1 Tax=Tetrabaena socialis TaxID=47790 RepID=A0A2J8AGS1_9CHLO|nr:Transportin-1 [Tetrabaena socialis]|eukprot:PNH11707.1 Transportin-1 [Tetrabaena socialis]
MAATTTWQPTQEGVLQLVNLLTLYQQPGTNQSQVSGGAHIFQQLEAYRAYPDFNNYLAFIFATGEQLPIEVGYPATPCFRPSCSGARHCGGAGLLLKNNLGKQYKELPSEFKAFIKGALLPLLGHASRELRHTAGTIASVIVGLGGLEEWTDLAAALPHCLTAEDPNVLDGALDTMYKAILEALAMALSRYTRRGVVVTYDALSCTARVLGARMADPALAGIVLPPLVQKFTAAPLADKDLLAAMECLANVTPHTGRAVELYARPMYDRAVALAGMHMQAAAAQQQRAAAAAAAAAAAPDGPAAVAPDAGAASEGGVEYDPNYVVLALDLISGLAQGLRTSVESLVAASPLVQMLTVCCACACLGDREELTFDYSSVTESEKEFRSAICLCGTRNCRGSYLYYSGSTAFTQVMEQRHNFLHRNSLLLRASIEPVGAADELRLREHSLGPTSLGDGSLGNDKREHATGKEAGAERGREGMSVVERGAAGRPLLDEVMGGVLGRMADHNKFVQAAAVSALAVVIETASEGHDSPDKLLEPYLKVSARAGSGGGGLSGDACPDVRQSAFALVGDLASACVAHLLPVLEALVACALALLELPRITDANLAAANNACWSLGEVVIKVDAERIAPHAEAIALRMTSILAYPGPGRMPPSILENCSITLGRTAWRCSEQLAPHLAHFVAQWCAQLRNIRDGTEKEHAFLGLCRLVRMNPEAALPAFPVLCAAFASWRRVGCEGLRNEMAQLMQLYKANLAASGQWEQVYARVGEPIRGKLGQMFGQALL